MQKFTKITIALAVLSTNLLFAQTMDEKIISFEKSRFSKNKRVQIKDVNITLKRKLSYGQWYGFIVDIKALMAGQEAKAKDIVFTDGNIVTPELFDINTGDSFKDKMNPDLTAKYYDKSKLIAGNPDAKDKLVVFSDPLCPFCMDFVPDVINHVKKNNKSIALYYYHFPLLRIHPASNALVRLMILAKKQGIKDIELKVYKADWDEYFDSRETNPKVIIDAFNKEFKTSFTKEQIEAKEVNKEMGSDITMGDEVLVQGTPTIFVNGQKDESRLKYEMLGN